MIDTHRFQVAAAAALVLAAIVAPPAAAGDFSLYGTYWDTDAADEAAGGGVTFAWGMSPRFDLELRGAFYQELTTDAFDNLFDDGDVFVDNGLEATPIELGIRYHFNTDSPVDPYLAGGGSYFLLDSDAGDIDDEFGFYGALGLTIGDDRGPAFFVEGTYRQVEGSVELDPRDFDDIDDLDFVDRVDVPLDGFGVNAGIRWSW